ncbi:hypothetical protein L2E82_32747 [Cichorium intybus]|uniref:Uncharacterized protein n=1 Tax=Cichorium intybus TaxID=13427 RepID=A0ACB9BHA8_CICIN|nr:hypothetical protein L2E82_32747 [Cichorium intybus]
MNGTIDAGEPSYTTGDTPNSEGGFTYGLEFFFVVLFLILVLSYGSYIYKRRMRSQSPIPLTTSFEATVDSDHDVTRLFQGLEDDVLATFPTFQYSDVRVLLKGETNTDSYADNYGSDCSICLADYKPADVIRLLPECGHLFHLSCIDTWLKVHPTCPVCRTSPLPSPADLT